VGGLLVLAACAPPKSHEATSGPTQSANTRRHGGRLVIALEAEPRTFNPVVVGDLSSRTILHRTTADLIHINRETRETQPHLAESWTALDNGRVYVLKLRENLRFSDGRPCTVDDVVFSFQVYLDKNVASPERSQLVFEGQPLIVKKIDQRTVEFEFPSPYAAAERIFDGLAILPRHRLEEVYKAGDLTEAWGLGTDVRQIVGLGPYRFKTYRAGDRAILERNPFYWKKDSDGQTLPYLEELVFVFTATKEAQTLRFLAGELDVIDRLGSEDFAVLERDAQRRGFQLHDLGPGLDSNFLFFNFNDLSAQEQPVLAHKQRWFLDIAFRRAVLSAIDLEAMVQIIYQGRATPLASFVTPDNAQWIDRSLPVPRPSLETAQGYLRGSGFRWDSEKRLIDRDGVRVEFSILTVATSPNRRRMATLIQSDLRQLGIEIHLVSLDLGTVWERIANTRDFEACILGLGGGSTSPNQMMNVLLSNGSHHLWHLGQTQPATAWEAEIDRLMQRQLLTVDVAERKKLFESVQRIVADQLPLISLVTPNVLVGADQRLGNFRPVTLSHHILWNTEELFWKSPGA